MNSFASFRYGLTRRASHVKLGLQIPSLDGLRAVSFSIVFIAHAGLGTLVPGAFGVTVFFFLSGYLITTLLRLEQEAAGRISLQKFYLRRVLRILPPFYIVLTCAILVRLAGLTSGNLDASATAAQFLHYANYRIVWRGFDGFAAGTGVFWSLAVEEHFYLLFPWLFRWLMRLHIRASQRAGILLAMCAAALAWRIFLVETQHPSLDRTAVASDTRFDSLLYGCALALYENPALEPTALSETIWKRVLFPLGVGGLLVSFLFRDDAFRETFRYTLQGASLVPIFVCAIRYPTWPPFRPLNTRLLKYLGALSYSLYLMHHVVLFALEHRAESVPKFARGVLAFAITFAFSWALYQLVEKPCARLRRQLSV